MKVKTAAVPSLRINLKQGRLQKERIKLYRICVLFDENCNS